MSTHATSLIVETNPALDGWYELECIVEYEFTPGDPGVRCYPDGSGCPPTPPEIEIISVEVEVIYPNWIGCTIDKLWLKDRGWDVDASRIARRIIEQELEEDSRVYCTLLAEATP